MCVCVCVCVVVRARTFHGMKIYSLCCSPNIAKVNKSIILRACSQNGIRLECSPQETGWLSRESNLMVKVIKFTVNYFK